MRGLGPLSADCDARYAGIKVLMIEDNLAEGQQIKEGLTDLGFSLDWARYGREAARLASVVRPDVVLLDLQLSDMRGIGGIEVCKQIRARLPVVPILILTILPDDGDLLDRLTEAGATNYIAKPCPLRRLAFHLHAAQQQANLVAQMSQAARDGRPRRIQAGELEVDLDDKQVFMGGREVRLTPKQYKVVELLAENLGTLVSYDTILERCWGPEWVGSQYRCNLRQFVAEIRAKIEPDSRHRRYIKTRFGYGYYLVIPPADPTEDTSDESPTEYL